MVIALDFACFSLDFLVLVPFGGEDLVARDRISCRCFLLAEPLRTLVDFGGIDHFSPQFPSSSVKVCLFAFLPVIVSEFFSFANVSDKGAFALPSFLHSHFRGKLIICSLSFSDVGYFLLTMA